MNKELKLSQIPDIDQTQNLWAEKLLTIQAELLSILYEEDLLEPYMQKTRSQYKNISPEHFSTQDWNKYKKIHKMTLKELTELGTQIKNHDQRIKYLTQVENILSLRINIINSFMPLIQFLAKRYSPYDYSLYLDLKSEGYIGLLKSLESFYYVEPGKSIKTYSTFYIKQEMRRYLLENKQGYKIPYIASLRQKKNQEENALDALEISKVQYFSELNNTITPNYENNIPSSIKDPLFYSWEHSLEMTLDRVLETLPANEKRVLELRYGLTDEYQELSLVKIGEIMGLSKERVRQIEKKALEHLYQRTKGIFKQEDLEDFFKSQYVVSSHTQIKTTPLFFLVL